MQDPTTEKLGSIRLTSQRKVILEELKAMKTHPTADELFHAVRQKLPKISLGTVYRNLESLSDAGYIQKLERTVGPKRFEANLTPHLHIRCKQCGAIEDIGKPAGLAAWLREKIQSGYQDIDHDLELSGICPDCAAMMKQKNP